MAREPKYLGFRREELAPGIDLFTKRDTSFKTASLKIYFLTDLGPDATRVALLPYVLRCGTKTWPRMIDLSRRLEELYGAILSVDVGKLAEWHSVSFRLNVVADEFIKGTGSVLEPTMQVLSELINEPRTENGAFLPGYMEQEKRSLKSHIESLINDKAPYAIEQLTRHMCRSEPYRFFEYGDVKDLPGINGKNQYEFYRRFITRSPIAVFAFGHIEPRRVKKLVCDYLLPDGRRKRRVKKKPTRVTPKKLRTIHEHMKLSLGHLVMGFRTGYRFGDPGQSAYSVYSTMLGGHMMSRLFTVLREKESLVYSVHASASLKSLLMVYAGVEAKNRKRAQKIILREMKSIEKGDFSKAEFQNAVNHLASSLRSVRDVPSRRIGTAFVQYRMGRPNSEKKIMKTLMAVTPEDVMRAAKTVTPDTYYFLG
ncbi:MAG: insulinase family protein [Planctomycetota bacterium]|nr:MAG: insulinase family protein [Planctomycetota bacterium]